MRATSPRSLYLRDFVAPGRVLHAASTTYGPGNLTAPHTHDFAEVFWIRAGRGIHRVNGRRLPLQAADLVFIRPHDVHALAAPRGEQMTLVNVAFSTHELRFLKQRYFQGQPQWPWGAPGSLPRVLKLGAGQMQHLDDWSHVLSQPAQSQMVLDAFLLEVLIWYQTRPPGGGGPQEPEWLRLALWELARSNRLAGGVSELARLAGRGRAHISRVVRRTRGVTPTELVNRLRLDRAARELRMTGRPIIRIALDCGWSNLSHFYRLFRQRFGLTPRQYRLRAQTPLRLPPHHKS